MTTSDERPAGRPVDEAMDAARPEKAAVRNIWAQVVERRKPVTPANVPFYLTLPGAEGKDLDLLIKRGLIATTESGAIADTDNRRVVAVERSLLASVNLRKRFSGLKVIQSDLLAALRGSGPAFPEGRERELFRATVVNLDFQGPWVASNRQFPTLEAIVKLAAIHRHPSPIDWTLCLTIQGEIQWSDTDQQAMQQFLAENFQRVPAFGEGARKVLGNDLHGRISRNEAVSLTDLPRLRQQALLMCLVPKQVAHRLHNNGWKVDTEHNLRYGGEGSAAPMVTWVMHMADDDRAVATPERVYFESLTSALSNPGEIASDGTIHHSRICSGGSG